MNSHLPVRLLGLPIACLLGCCLMRPAWANQPIAAVGEGVSVQNADPAMPSPPSMLSAALLGHWANEDGTIHYYVGQQQIIVLHLGQHSIRKQKLSYAISSLNEVTNFMQIRIETPLGWAQERQLHLAAVGQSPVGDPRRTLTETMNVMGHFFSSTWTYVDNQQQPLSFVPAQVGASIPASVAGDGATR